MSGQHKRVGEPSRVGEPCRVGEPSGETRLPVDGVVVAVADEGRVLAREALVLVFKDRLAGATAKSDTAANPGSALFKEVSRPAGLPLVVSMAAAALSAASELATLME